jgi:Protein YTP1-like, C-terminal
MERFGAAHGSPFTTKQMQHISIAAMFWFAGMLGLALESRTFRKWLSSPAQSVIKRDEKVSRPPSYAGSFNPFPALVIGVTGAAMSAHHQTYLFQACSSSPLLYAKAYYSLAIGTNSCPLGLLPHRFRCIPMLDLFLPLAPPTTICTPLAPTYGGRG